MPTKDRSMNAMPAPLNREGFAPLGARRLLVLGGIGLILAGMIFGDIFAVFVLHQNAGHVGSSRARAAQAARAGDSAAALSHFRAARGFPANRGPTRRTRVHMP